MVVGGGVGGATCLLTVKRLSKEAQSEAPCWCGPAMGQWDRFDVFVTHQQSEIILWNANSSSLSFGMLHKRIDPGMFHKRIDPGMFYKIIDPGMFHKRIDPGMFYKRIDPGMFYKRINPGRTHKRIDPGRLHKRFEQEN